MSDPMKALSHSTKDMMIEDLHAALSRLECERDASAKTERTRLINACEHALRDLNGGHRGNELVIFRQGLQTAISVIRTSATD